MLTLFPTYILHVHVFFGCIMHWEEETISMQNAHGLSVNCANDLGSKYNEIC